MSFPHTPRSLGRTFPASVDQLADAREVTRWHRLSADAVSTGFPLLDHVIGGGLLPESLHVVGGGAGSGKSVLLLQWAAHIAERGTSVLYVTRERSPMSTLEQLLTSCEVAIAPQRGRRPSVDHVGFGTKLWIGHQSDDLVDDLTSMVSDCGARVVLIDGLRAGETASVVSDIKDLAVSEAVAVVVAVAPSITGLGVSRVRIQHLWCAEAVATEADTVVLLNGKRHLTEQSYGSAARRSSPDDQMVVFTVEKNRFGPTWVELEHEWGEGHRRFDPLGGHVVDTFTHQVAR